MGTKIQQATDLLATKRTFTESETRNSMERALDERSIEAIKKTMLKQEEVFKQQVRELHRLYRVQRILMDEMKKQVKQESKAPTSARLKYNFQIQSSLEQNVNVTKSCSSSSASQKGIDFAITRRVDNQEDNFTGAGPSSSSMIKPKFGLEEDLCVVGVDLSLSLGGGSNNRTSKSSIELEFSQGKEKSHDNHPVSLTSSMTSSTRFHHKEEEKRPHWSF